MKLLPPLLLAAAFLARLPGQDPSPLLSLRAEMEKAAAERDAARRQLLIMEADGAPRLQELERNNTRLQAEVDSLSTKLMNAEANALAASAALRRADSDLKRREEQVEEMRSRLTASQAAFAETLHQLRADSDTSHTARLEAEARRDQLQRELNENQTLFDQARALRDEVARERAQFLSLRQGIEHELKTARRAEALALAKAAAVDSRRELLVEELRQTREERARLEAERDTLRSEVAHLNERLGALSRDNVPREVVDALEKELERLRVENDTLRRVTADSPGDAEWREDLRKTREQRDRLAAEKALAEQRLQEAERAIREELAPVREALATLEAENLRLQQERMLQRSEVDQLSQLLNDEQTRNRAKVLDLEGQLNQRIRELAEARVRIEELARSASRVPALEAERAQLAERGAKARNDLRILAEHIHQLRQNISEGRAAKALLAESREEADSLRRSLESSRGQADSLRQTREALESELEALRRRLHQPTSP